MGGRLKLRQLAKPLDEARKDAKVDKAVLFVEDLFGRKMRNKDTKILLVTDKNRSCCIYALKYDPKYIISKRVRTTILLYMEPKIVSLISKKTKEYFREEYQVSLSEFIKWINEDIKNSERKEILEIIGEVNPDLYEKIFGVAEHIGMYLPAENMVIARDYQVPVLVHELIHAEDKNISNLEDPIGKLISDLKNPIRKMISEGRAYYGECLYWRIENGMDLDTLQILRDVRGKSMFGRDGIIKRNFLLLWNGLDREDVKKIARTAMLDSLEGILTVNWDKQKHYIPFTIVLAELAHTLNDPYAAFRITTKKQPRTKEELKNFKEFYKNEIEEYKRQN